MFTTVSLSVLSDDNTITEIRYDFISSENEIAFSMGEIHFEEKPIEQFIADHANKQE